MSELLTFANFSPLREGANAIYDIGKTIEGSGVITEMAKVFGHELTELPTAENLGKLIAAVGPAKELQQNIDGVQEVLGTSQDAIGIARDWVERSGLLVPVERTFAGADTTPRVQYDLSIITGGVRNWMHRRAELLEQIPSWHVLLIAGNRPMKSAEGPDVEEGMTEQDYMREVIAPRMIGKGMLTDLVEVASSVGNEVMAEGARSIADIVNMQDETVSVIVASNAGAWVQNAGQMRRAIRAINPDFDAQGDQLCVASDSFALGTGAEPTATHQNPFSALGQIARNAQELAKHSH